MEVSVEGAVLRRKDVEIRTGLKRSTIYDHIRAGIFPRPVRITCNRVAWRVRDIEAWLRNPANYRAPTAEPEIKPSRLRDAAGRLTAQAAGSAPAAGPEPQARSRKSRAVSP